MGEFELIERFFKRGAPATGSVALGIGDDCALLQPTPGQQLAISTDMLVEDRHFLPGADPGALGHKALAVNLSDLAAMGAEPLAFTLALALPPERAQDEAWLGALAQGLFTLADAHQCPLIGGDTTAGPLNLCITVFGQVPAGQALRRDGACAGDDVWVSGTPGQARLGLQALRGEITLAPAALAPARAQLERPTPRLALGRTLRGIASSAIDLSDGLVGDLGHVLAASGVGAAIDTATLVQALADSLPSTGSGPHLSEDDLRTAALSGGDDYELAFTAAPGVRAAVLAAAQASGTPVTRVGRIEATPGLRLLGADGQPISPHYRSFDHFA
jgi:thiamine-monophosphate kinase